MAACCSTTYEASLSHNAAAKIYTGVKQKARVSSGQCPWPRNLGGDKGFVPHSRLESGAATQGGAVSWDLRRWERHHRTN